MPARLLAGNHVILIVVVSALAHRHRRQHVAEAVGYQRTSPYGVSTVIATGMAASAAHQLPRSPSGTSTNHSDPEGGSVPSGVSNQPSTARSWLPSATASKRLNRVRSPIDGISDAE